MRSPIVSTQKASSSQVKILGKGDSFVEVAVLDDTFATFDDTHKLFKASPFVPKELPDQAAVRPGVPGRIGKALGLYTESCQQFNYGQTILRLESILLQLRHNMMFIDFFSL